MSHRARWLATPVLLTLLAACSTPVPRPTPSLPPEMPPPAPPTAPARPASVPAKPVPAPGLWSRMRAHFAMPGCDAAPAISRWAGRFTRHPRAFERYLRSVMPTIAYVEQAAQQADVPAEFSLLPWVESRYRAVPPRGRRSAGMWQIVPVTAHTLHLPIQHDYDARLDRIRSTHAVMAMLQGYHRRWRDWRLVDMAYNAGQYRIRHLQPQGPAPDMPVLPDLAVSPITHDHLAQLLAMACVIRNPQRFGVRLPELPKTGRLEAVSLPRPSTLHAVARAAGMPLARVRRINGAYLHGRMPGEGPWHVLLPASDARKLRQAVAAGRLPRQPAVYTVVPGDSLWTIARRHGLSVSQLRRFNHLHGNRLHPGQVLRIEARSD